MNKITRDAHGRSIFADDNRFQGHSFLDRLNAVAIVVNQIDRYILDVCSVRNTDNSSEPVFDWDASLDIVGQ